MPFAWYRIAFGAVVLVTAWTGVVRWAVTRRTRGATRAGSGPLCAVVGMLGFSFKAILIKLAYAWHPVDAITLLALRMLYSAPFFIAMAWWAARGARRRSRGATGSRLVWLGFIGYYLASLLDFMGLHYITASLERLVLYLYPTMVVLLSALFLRQADHAARDRSRWCSRTPGIALVFWHDLRRCRRHAARR